MTIRFPLSWIFLCLCSLAYAGVIQGNVVSTNGEPVPSYIRLYNGAQAIDSAKTNLFGIFNLTTDSGLTQNNDSLRMEVRAERYHSKTLYIQADKDINLKNITLEKDSTIELAEVQVMSSRRISLVDKTIVYPEKTILKHNSSPLGVLQDLMLPGLEINTTLQSANIHGKKVLFRINGVPRSIESVLSLSPSDIQKIEYSNSVSIQDAASNSGGYVNIILKPKEYGGTVYSSIHSALTTGMINENTGLSYNFLKSNFSLTYNLQWRDYDRLSDNTRILYCGGEDHLIRTTRGKNGHLGMTLNNLLFSYTYTPDKHSVLSLSLSYLWGPWKRHIRYINQQITEGGSIIPYNSDKSINQPYSIPVFDIFFKRDIRDGGFLQLNSTLVYNYSDNRWSQTNRFPEGENHTYDNDGKSKSLSVHNDLYWSKRYGLTVLKIGLKDSYDHTFNKYLSNNTSTSITINSNTLLSYVELTGRHNIFSYTLGSGLYHNYISDSSVGTRSYLDNYSIGKWRLSGLGKFSMDGTISYSPQFPPMAALSDIYMTVDDLTASKGNPSLRPSSTLDTEMNINFSHKEFSSYLRLDVSQIWDPILSNTFYEDNRYVTQSQNGKRHLSYSLGANLQYRKFCGDDFSFGVSLSGELRFQDSRIDQRHRYNLKTFVISGNSFITYHDWTFGISANSKSKSLYGDMIYTNGSYSNISLSYTWRNFNFSVVGSWIGINKGDYKYQKSLSDLNPSDSETIIKDNSNTIGLAITYRLDYGRIFNRRTNNLNSNQFKSKNIRLLQ